MNELVRSLLSDKGTKSYRLILIVMVIYGVEKLKDIEKRLAVIEWRIDGRAGDGSTNKLAKLQ